ncbi:hypothetical protein THAOC_09927 [Thalassiosira oceanica]|uniref:Uncharacterized protein n=1 Tax=Thalassiosira oceanica TaxID=159749 RepID=K0STX7_THAOC|nr:hypothetical protein THAOC_09927 [Thalassiosira oceanica]|eukprot:EJK68860.1 hypothetical protein THAOC_09927 [Thalassiosira oceanica]
MLSNAALWPRGRLSGVPLARRLALMDRRLCGPPSTGACSFNEVLEDSQVSSSGLSKAALWPRGDSRGYPWLSPLRRPWGAGENQELSRTPLSLRFASLRCAACAHGQPLDLSTCPGSTPCEANAATPRYSKIPQSNRLPDQT